jgi:transposase
MDKKFIGIDYHKKYSQITVMDQAGVILDRARIRSEKAAVETYFKDIKGPSIGVMEASRSWGKMYDVLEEELEEVILAHPQQVRAIAAARVKTDKISSEILAHLLRTDLIPKAHIPSKETRGIKYRLRQRMFLVKIQTMLKNRIHDLLDRNHIEVKEEEEFTDLFGKAGLTYLKRLKLPNGERALLRRELKFLQQTREHIEATNKEIKEIGARDQEVQWVKSVPGMGDFFSLLVVKEIDKIDRFADVRKLWSYAGITPSVFASGNRSYNGRITKQGNKYLRWAVVEGIIPAIRKSPRLKQYYEKIKRKKGPNAAKVATARKLLELIYCVLKQKRNYYESKEFPSALVTS